jgi:N-acetylneuraminic acid mutarotase
MRVRAACCVLLEFSKGVQSERATRCVAALVARFCLWVVAFFPLAGIAAWEQIAPLPTPNGGFGCGILNGKIVVLGGTNWKDERKEWLDGIWVYEPQAARWEKKGKLPQPLAFPVVAKAGDELLIAGGSDGAKLRSEIWRLESSFKLTAAGELSQPRAAAVGDLVSGKLVIAGGCADPAALAGLCKGVEVHSWPKNDLIESALPMATGLAIGAYVTIGTELFVFGGASRSAAGELMDSNETWKFNATSNSWRQLAPYPLKARGAAAVTLGAEHVLIGGGFGGPKNYFLAAAYIYDVQQNTFRQSLDLPLAALVGLVACDGYVYCLGGEDRERHRTDACFRIAAKELLATTR